MTALVPLRFLDKKITFNIRDGKWDSYRIFEPLCRNLQKNKNNLYVSRHDMSVFNLRQQETKNLIYAVDRLKILFEKKIKVKIDQKWLTLDNMKIANWERQKFAACNWMYAETNEEEKYMMSEITKPNQNIIFLNMTAEGIMRELNIRIILHWK